MSFHGRGVAALAYLTVAGSIAGFVSYIYALKYLPVSTVSIYAYINPLIAVILGALLLDEPFSARTVVAMAIVFVGVALVKQPATKTPRRFARADSPNPRERSSRAIRNYMLLPCACRRSAVCRSTPTGWGFFLCTEKSMRMGRGGEYVAAILQDATGELVARVLDNVDRLKDEFEAGEFVKAQGRLVAFNGRSQFQIDSIRRVMLAPDSQDRREGFREELLVRHRATADRRDVDELEQIVGRPWKPAPTVAADDDRRHQRRAAEDLACRPYRPPRLSRWLPRTRAEGGRGRSIAGRHVRRRCGSRGRRRRCCTTSASYRSSTTTSRRPTRATAT